MPNESGLSSRTTAGFGGNRGPMCCRICKQPGHTDAWPHVPTGWRPMTDDEKAEHDRQNRAAIDAVFAGYEGEESE